MRNKPTMVTTVQTPMVFKESRACSTAPVLTSEEMSNIFSVASKPGRGSGSSTSHTLRKMMKYITPKNPANMEATIPMKAKVKASPSSNVTSGPSAKAYAGWLAKRKIAGKVKMKPVEACVAPVVADVAMLTSEGDHLSAMPSKYAMYQAAEMARPSLRPM